MINEELFKRFCERRPEYGLQANESYLYDVVQHPATVEGLCRAADQMEDRLLLAPEYKSAWEQFIFLNPEKNGLAFRRQFLEEMRKKEIKRNYEKNYNDLIKELGEQLRGLPIEDLRDIAATRRENERRKSLSASELRDLSRAENPRPTREELPMLYTPRGHTQQITLSAEVLRSVGQPNSPLPLWDFKYLNTRYPGQINARMNAVKKPTYKPLPSDVTKEQVIAVLRDRELNRIWSRTYGSEALNNRVFGIS